MTTEWKCTGCGATALSKCISSRTIFPQGEGSLYLSLLDVRVQRREGTKGFDASISIFQSKEGGATDVDLIGRLLHTIRAMPEELVEQLACVHNYVLDGDEDTCDFGCHTKG